jgi:thioredoxin-like negative regulator of GroEL
MKLVYFHSEECGVCREKESVVQAVARDMGLPLETVDVERDDGPARAEALRVKTVPTLALVDGERVPFRLVGVAITPENVAHLSAATRRAE